MYCALQIRIAFSFGVPFAVTSAMHRSMNESLACVSPPNFFGIPYGISEVVLHQMPQLALLDLLWACLPPRQLLPVEQ